MNVDRQGNLRLAQDNGFFIDRHAPGRLIQRDVAARQDLLNSAFDPTKHGLGSRNDLLWIEGLDDVVVRSAVQSDDSLGVSFPGRQHDYRNV